MEVVVVHILRPRTGARTRACIIFIVVMSRRRLLLLMVMVIALLWAVVKLMWVNFHK